ncbi:MAG: hypothetical protein ACI8T1_004707 [Verrucomicrobiales bacterium]
MKQTGVTNKPLLTIKARKGCNRILKNYLVQAAAKMRDWGPEGLKDVYAKLKDNGQHADFIIAKRLRRTFKYMMVHQTIYLPPSLRGDWNEDTRESITTFLVTTKEKIAAKWNRVGQARDAMEPTSPIGLWWQTIEAAFQNICGDDVA